ncbi:uncharacterized protein LOC128760329 isoform X2 [Synchiropus splendidus]|nr:uncharacterized protein LOC128760329 isoform X2 [Synchiropus splendidus]
MEAEPTDKPRPSHGQLIYVPHKDTVRLLEVYVKRSLSLNDGTLGAHLSHRKEKWVMPKRPRRHSSDPSLHVGESVSNEEIGVFAASELEKQLEGAERKSKKPKKKASLWKNFVSFFSRKIADIEEEPESSAEEPDPMASCVPTTPNVSMRKKKSSRKKSLRRHFSKKRLSLIKLDKEESCVTAVDAVSVESTYSYYEKVSEELDKIIHEVKEEVPASTNDTDLSNYSSQRVAARKTSGGLIKVSEELEKILLDVKEKKEAPALTKVEIQQLIAITMKEGDAINDKIKENKALSNFFEQMSYSAFQKLADVYIESEATPTYSPPTVLPTAPELVKLAFTLDFTARIAALSKQNVSHITSLGNRYLRDRFEYQQACTDHPWSETDD